MSSTTCFVVGQQHASVRCCMPVTWMWLLQVGTLWQSCVATVHNFPLFPDIVAHANFLADQAGEPSVQELHVAVMGSAAGPCQGR